MAVTKRKTGRLLVKKRRRILAYDLLRARDIEVMVV
jgi:hypothetical protein